MKHLLLVWITLGLSVLSLLVAVFGFFAVFVHLMDATYIPNGIGALLTAKFVAAVYLGLVVYGVIRRTRWGHGISISYALLLLLASLLRDPVAIYRHPAMSVSPAHLKVVHVVVIAFYAFMVMFGSRPFRECFSPPQEPDVPVLETDPAPTGTAPRRASLPPQTQAQTPAHPALPDTPREPPATSVEPRKICLSFD